ncbi:MAG: hypothetical protein P8R38_00440, partial [Planctomycetota bacterium]|nr:hypothetical protein [Planctomycetota bacterium]
EQEFKWAGVLLQMCAKSIFPGGLIIERPGVCITLIVERHAVCFHKDDPVLAALCAPRNNPGIRPVSPKG